MMVVVVVVYWSSICCDLLLYIVLFSLGHVVGLAGASVHYFSLASSLRRVAGRFEGLFSCAFRGKPSLG